MDRDVHRVKGKGKGKIKDLESKLERKKWSKWPKEKGNS